MQLFEQKMKMFVKRYRILVKFSAFCGTQDRLSQIIKTKNYSVIHVVLYVKQRKQKLEKNGNKREREMCVRLGKSCWGGECSLKVFSLFVLIDSITCAVSN